MGEREVLRLLTVLSARGVERQLARLPGVERAVADNVAALPAAAGVFSPPMIGPEVAALSMSGSSVLVAVNALLLKRTKLGGTR